MYEEKLNNLGYHEAFPKPTQKVLDNHYKNKYYQQPEGSYATNYTKEELEYFNNIASVSEYFLSRYNIMDKNLLDLGCGEGFFASSFYKLGWAVRCVDFSNYGVTEHNPDMLPFFDIGDIFTKVDCYTNSGDKFSVVNLQNVLEHVIDPVNLLQKIKAILKKDSILRIRVPNDYSTFQLSLFDNKLTSKTWFSPPEHLSYFNSKSLLNILEHCGYRILSLQADFPIELFLVNPHSNYWKDRGLGKGAHLTRVFCENYLINKNMDAYIRYTEAAAELEYGRDLIAYAVMI